MKFNQVEFLGSLIYFGMYPFIRGAGGEDLWPVSSWLRLLTKLFWFGLMFAYIGMLIFFGVAICIDILTP